MHKLFVSCIVVFLSFGISSTASAQGLPVCDLGGGTAMNPDRRLGEGESFVFTDRPLVVNLQFKPTKERPERVGECMLPKGAKVAEKNGILQWVAECGNDEVNRNIPVGPTTIKLVLGPQGDIGPQGSIGPKGDQGLQGIPGARGARGETVQSPPKTKGFPWKKTLLVVGGVVAVGSGYAVYRYYQCPPGTTRR